LHNYLARAVSVPPAGNHKDGYSQSIELIYLQIYRKKWFGRGTYAQDSKCTKDAINATKIMPLLASTTTGARSGEILFAGSLE
jgi:hypothetical protein